MFVGTDFESTFEKTILIIELNELIDTTKKMKHLIYFVLLFKLMQSSIYDL